MVLAFVVQLDRITLKKRLRALTLEIAALLRPGDLAVFDKLSEHKDCGARQIPGSADACLRILPPCSKYFNPIKKAILPMIPGLRKVTARNWETQHVAMANAAGAHAEGLLKCATSTYAAGRRSAPVARAKDSWPEGAGST